MKHVSRNHGKNAFISEEKTIKIKIEEELNTW